VERGKDERKTVLDAMRDGDEGMQCFDLEIEKCWLDLHRSGLLYATNADNLRLQLVNFLDPQGGTPAVMRQKEVRSTFENTEIKLYGS
jgi:hypothetical protein